MFPRACAHAIEKEQTNQTPFYEDDSQQIIVNEILPVIFCILFKYYMLQFQASFFFIIINFNYPSTFSTKK